MVNYGPIDTVPERYKSRQLYSWAPDVTLMRTNEIENAQLGEMLANKVNESKASAAILLPNKGVSQVDAKGGIFYQPTYNRILFDTIKKQTKTQFLVRELDLNINDEAFAVELVNTLLKMIK